MNRISVDMAVPASHPALPGHFPGQPIVPGVVLLAMAHEQARAHIGFTTGPTRWSRIKFLRPILPEQPFRVIVEGDEQRFNFQIETSAGEAVARGQCRHAKLA
ncbi:MAG: hypothetical protein EA370_15700 [Wenzhouxiangella sp.]|nr:MAG: hypothetical protein EA370_15700 [Wenzhouxiangella sp.]